MWKQRINGEEGEEGRGENPEPARVKFEDNNNMRRNSNPSIHLQNSTTSLTLVSSRRGAEDNPDLDNVPSNSSQQRSLKKKASKRKPSKATLKPKKKPERSKSKTKKGVTKPKSKESLKRKSLEKKSKESLKRKSLEKKAQEDQDQQDRKTSPKVEPEPDPKPTKKPPPPPPPRGPLSEDRLSYNPNGKGPTIIELGDKNSPKNPPEPDPALCKKPSSTSVLRRGQSRKPGKHLKMSARSKMRLEMEDRVKLIQAEPQAKPKRPPSRLSAKRSQTSNNRKQQDHQRPPPTPKLKSKPVSRASVAHKTTRKRGKRKKLKKSAEFEQSESFTTFVTAPRKPSRGQSKEPASRADSLRDPIWIGRVEFENKNGKILRSTYLSWEQEQGSDGSGSDNECFPCTGRRGLGASWDLTNEALDQMLDNNLNLCRSSAPVCNQNPLTDNPCSENKSCK
jgi:hypothetical protein